MFLVDCTSLSDIFSYWIPLLWISYTSVPFGPYLPFFDLCFCFVFLGFIIVHENRLVKQKNKKIYKKSIN